MGKNRLLGVFAVLTAFVLSSFAGLAQDAQKKTITGIITDQANTPLANATVSVKGKRNISAVTDANGAFKLSVPTTTKTLVVSYVGMKEQEISIEGKTNVVVALDASASKLDEVVVIGYGTTKRSAINSAISSISANDIKDLPQAGLDQMLQGKVPGVSVASNTGQPGGGVSVRIRGITTINGNDPLYVIDGVQIQSSTSSTPQDQLGGVPGQSVQSPLATLNPDDIATVDILKDASAQAIYGSAAANGVVLITTKHGRAGEGKLNYTTYLGTSELYKKLPIMDLSQYASYYNSVQAEQGAQIGLDTIGEFKYPNLLGKGSDWQGAVFQKGFTQNHQIAFSGGANKTTYYVSGNYFDQTGTLIGSYFKRYAFRGSIDQQVKSWLKAGISTNFSGTNQKITVTDGQQSVIPLMLYNSPATAITLPDGSYATTQNIAGVAFGNNNNPVALARLRDTRAKQYKGFGNLYADIFFLKNLDFRTQFNYDFQLNMNTAFQPSITNSLGQTILAPSVIQETRGTNIYVALQNYLTYTPTFGKHQINLLVGHEASTNNYDYTTTTANSLVNNIESIAAGTIVATSSGGGKYSGANESYFARATYTYDNKYSVTGSERRDGSSNFGPNKRIGYFSAGSAGWTISNENFAKNWSFVKYLKLRAGVGQTGNSNTGGNQVYSTNIRLATSAGGLFGGTGGVPGVPANVGNPNLQWQALITYNLGLDATLLNGRIEASVDVYKKVTSKMILSTVLPSFAGLDPNPPANAYNQIEPPVTNAGQMTNKGIDIGITSHNIVSKGFEWKTTLEYSMYKNVLDRLTNPGATLFGKSADFAPVTLTATTAGQAVGQFFGYQTNGLYRTMTDLNNGPTPQLPVGLTGTWLGDIRYKDLNGDKKITSADETFIGNPNPKFTYGMTNSFTYKGFDLSIFISGVYGDQIFNYSRTQDESLYNVYQNQLNTVMNRYTATNTGAKLPRYNQYNQDNLIISDRWIEDGSYLRIQNVTLGYNVPVKWAARAKMTACRIYLSAQNLYTFTKYSGYDPEVGAFNGNIETMNIDYGHYPNPRTLTIGANLEF
ncbi:MAG TPA: TonB-dependent receptor [Chitinophagaceae bacterium]|jgi:TonB-linked SusC/RagA family outer membrane protein